MNAVFALLWLIRWLPMPVIGALAWLLGTVACLLAGERRRVGQRNLRLCFPELSTSTRNRILRKHFRHMIRLVLEYGVLWWSPANRLARLVTIKNLDYVTDLRAQGKNVILFYPHFVGFELCVFALNQTLPLVSVYSQQKNDRLDAQIYRGRQRYNNAYIVSRQAGIRPIIKAMKKDHVPFLYLPDQDYGPRDSVFVKFFGVETATITGLSRISQLADAVVVPAIASRIGNRCELTFYPPWQRFPGSDLNADAQRMNDFLEARIREQPEQYFWLHKRFKTRPEGQPPMY